MKIGIRTPSIKKSIKARTTGKVKRTIKSSVNPLYGKKGIGYINDPKKAVYNKVYNKTTVGARDVINNVSNDELIKNEGMTQYENITQDKDIIQDDNMSLFGCAGAFIALIFNLVKLIFYFGLLIALIWFIVQIFKA